PGGQFALLADYTQWEELQKKAVSLEKVVEPKKDTRTPVPTMRKGKLSYHEKRELEQIEQRIEEAELLVRQLENQVEDPTIASHPSQLQEACEALQKAQDNLENLFKRWQELEDKQKT